MTNRTPRESVLRALDELLPFLHGFVNHAFDESAYRGKRVTSDIGPLVHAMKDEWRGVFAARLDGSVRNYLHELLDIRNRLSHSKTFSENDARRACDTIQLVAQAIGAPLAEYDRRTPYEIDSPRAPEAHSLATATPRARDTGATSASRAGQTPRRSQRDTMRSIWAACAPDEDRAICIYAAAEARGDVSRKQNKSGHTAEQYARALLADGLKKGWLARYSDIPSEMA